MNSIRSVYLAKNKIIPKLQLVIDCTNKFADNKRHQNNDVALTIDPLKSIISFVTSIRMQPAQIECTTDAIFNSEQAAEPFSVIINAQVLINIFQVIEQDFIECAFDFKKMKVNFFPATYSDKTLFNDTDTIVRRDTKHSYFDSFEMLENFVEYEITYPEHNLPEFSVTHHDVDYLKAIQTLVKHQNEKISRLSLEIKTSADHCRFTGACSVFYVSMPLLKAYSTPLSDPVRVYLNSDTLNILIVLTSTFMQKFDMWIHVLFSEQALFIQTSEFKVKIQSVVGFPQKIRQIMDFSACEDDWIEANTFDIQKSLTKTAITDLKQSDTVILSLDGSNHISVMYKFGGRGANTVFDIQSPRNTNNLLTIEVKRPLFSDAVSIFSKRKNVRILGLLSQQLGLVMTDFNNECVVIMQKIGLR